MAILGRWVGANTTLIPTTSWTAPASLFPTQQRNDSAAYSFNSATSTLSLPATGLANGYLIVASYRFQDTSNGRHNPQGRIIQTSGSGNFVGTPAGGYSRDASEDTAYVRCWAFIDSPSASAEFQFQFKRDVDTPSGGTNLSTFEVIPLYYSSIGMYSNTSTAFSGATTPTTVAGWSTVVESSSTISIAGGATVTISGEDKRYLTLGAQFYEGGAGRTQRWFGVSLDGAPGSSSKAYSYFRDSSNDENGGMYTILQATTGTTPRTLTQFCYRGAGVLAGEGGADASGGTPTFGSQAWVTLELNDEAEVFRSSDTAGGVDLNVTTPVDQNIATTVYQSDVASFTKISDSQVRINKAADTLFGANISAAQEVVATTSRWTAQAQFTINSAEDFDTFHGNYARNNQGSTDTFGWSANLLSYISLSTNDLVGVSTQELPGGEDGGQYEVQPSWAGFWGINLDTLQPSGVIIESDADSSSTASLATNAGVISLGAGASVNQAAAVVLASVLALAVGTSDTQAVASGAARVVATTNATAAGATASLGMTAPVLSTAAESINEAVASSNTGAVAEIIATSESYAVGDFDSDSDNPSETLAAAIGTTATTALAAEIVSTTALTSSSLTTIVNTAATISTTSTASSITLASGLTGGYFDSAASVVCTSAVAADSARITPLSASSAGQAAVTADTTHIFAVSANPAGTTIVAGAAAVTLAVDASAAAEAIVAGAGSELIATLGAISSSTSVSGETPSKITVTVTLDGSIANNALLSGSLAINSELVSITTIATQIAGGLNQNIALVGTISPGALIHGGLIKS